MFMNAKGSRDYDFACQLAVSIFLMEFDLLFPKFQRGMCDMFKYISYKYQGGQILILFIIRKNMVSNIRSMIRNTKPVIDLVYPIS